MDNDEIIKKISNLEMRLTVLEQKLTTKTSSPTGTHQKKQSAKEFLLTKNISGDVQKTLILAYYLEHVEGLESFNVPDLEKIFQLAKEKKPSNLNDMVNKNISSGYIMDFAEKKDSKKAWTLTSSGEKFVETLN